MRVNSVSVSDELLILKACVCDKATLSRLVTIRDDVKFKTKHGKLIFAWCVAHFDQYDDVPGEEVITREFTKWAQRHDEDKVVSRLENFLHNLDDVPINSDYVADKISEYFSRISLETLSDELVDVLQVGDVAAAVEMVAGWRPVQLGTDASVDVLRDQEAIREAFEKKAEGLIEYPGELGAFFGHDLARDSLFAFMGPEKRGKTFWLSDVAWRAMQSRRRVAFFGIGDMSRSQYMARFMVRASRRPLRAATLAIPTSLAWDADRKGYEIEFKEKAFTEDLTWGDAWRSCEKIVNHSGSAQPMLRLSVHANSTVGVADIEMILDFWERDGWAPDVIVIDYADLLTFPTGTRDERDGSNRNWKLLRKISQERHCLVVTATQANSQSYEAYVITRRHFSEDKRKLAHVTGMVGLNQTDAEKKDGVMRLNWVVRRDSYFSEYRCCLVAGRREVGNLAIRSAYA